MSLKRLFVCSLSATLLAGCDTMQNNSQNVQFDSANRVVEKPVVVQPPVMQMRYQLSNGTNPALMRAYNEFLKTGRAKNIVTDGFEQFAYGTGNQPVIAATPLELTVISLEPGENVTNVSSGDPLRWSYSMAYSGQGRARQAHVMIKPVQPSISTDLVITTDKRLYTLKMVSTTDGKYVRDVRFWYPMDMKNYWENYNAQQTQQFSDDTRTKIADVPTIDIHNLNFNYKIASGSAGIFSSTPSWAPTRVFDDGTHTYIQFPASITSRDMPALFIMNKNGKEELVNYRSKPPYFVVDKIFKQAVLVLGVGNDKTSVIITNNCYES